MTVFSPGRVVPALVVGVAAYLVVRALLDFENNADPDSVSEVVNEARERIARETRIPSDASIGALGELARVTHQS